MNQYHKTLIALSASCALGLSSIRAEDNTTNIISGTLSDNGGANYVVGLTGINNYLQIDSGGQLVNVNFAYIGSNATASANAALITGANSVMLANNQYQIGRFGDSNSLTIADGGVVAGLRIFVGAEAGSDYNQVLVTGTNSALQILAGTGNNVLVGRNGSRNSLIVSNGATVGPTPGIFAIGNGATANNNWAVVTGPGSTVTANTDGYTGSAGANNNLTIADGGTVTALNSLVIGGPTATSFNNATLVTGTNSSMSTFGVMYVGTSGASNSVTIADGGQVASGECYIGTLAGANMNSVLVTGAGSVWSNDTAITLGAVGLTSSNNLTIAGGGKVNTLTACNVGVGAGAAGNSVLVTGADSLLEVGAGVVIGVNGAGTGNTMTIANGGALKANAVIMQAATTRLNINGGKLIAQGTNFTFIAAATNGNAYIQAGGAVFDSNGKDIRNDIPLEEDPVSTGGGLTKIGVGELRLSGTNTYTGSTVVEAGSFGGNAALLSSSLLVKSGAQLAPGNGIGTLASAGPVTLEGGSTARMEISGSGAYDSVASSNTITLNGTLEVVQADTNDFSLGQTFVLFQSLASLTGNFTATNLPVLSNPNLAWQWVATNGTLSVIYNGPSTPTNITHQYDAGTGTLELSWPESYQGWVAQSNAVGVAEPSAWFDIPNSESATNLTITIDPAMTNVFFRLRYP